LIKRLSHKKSTCSDYLRERRNPKFERGMEKKALKKSGGTKGADSGQKRNRKGQARKNLVPRGGKTVKSSAEQKKQCRSM